MKLKKDKNKCSILIEVPNELPTIELTPEDILANEEVVIDNTTYIWVDGYKGVDKDMQAYGDFQYEINTSYILNEVPSICRNGYHFCVNLEDVFEFYEFDFSNRYFKVRALVNKEEYESYGKESRVKHYLTYGLFSYRHPYSVQPQPYKNGRDSQGDYYLETIKVNKLSAKAIILTEEITLDKYFDYIPFIDMLSKYWIESKEELFSIKDFSVNGIREYLDNKFITKAFKYYTPDFMRLYLQKYGNWESISVRAQKLSHIIKVIEVCHLNGLTKDATTMIIMDEKL